MNVNLASLYPPFLTILCYFEANLRHHTFIGKCMCYGLNICVSRPNSYSEAQAPNVVVFGDATFWEVVRFGLGHEGGTLWWGHWPHKKRRREWEGACALQVRKESPPRGPRQAPCTAASRTRKTLVLFKPLHLGCFVMAASAKTVWISKR